MSVDRDLAAKRPGEPDEDEDAPVGHAGPTPHRSWSPSRTLLRRALLLLTLSTLVVGALLIVGRDSFSRNPAVRDQILSFGSTLATFGFTTLLVTIFASSQLQNELLSQIDNEMTGHVRNVQTAMKRTAQTFERSINDFNPLVGNCARLGLVNVYLTRPDALSDFADHLEEELKEAASAAASAAGPTSSEFTPKARLWIVSSSMKGIRETAAGRFDGAGVLTWAGELAAKDLLDMRVLMTHPRYANLRASQELRLVGAIPEEIKETLAFLKSCKVPVDRVRLVRATPTVFAVATRVEMLLNPYPYSAEAFRSFTLRVRKVHLAPSDRHSAIHRDIFEQYEYRHFEIPWQQGMGLTSDYGIPDVPALTVATAESDDDALQDGEA